MKGNSSIPLRLWLPVFVAGALVLLLVASAFWRDQQETRAAESRTRELVRHRMVDEQHRIEQLLRAGDAGLVAEEIAQFGSVPEVVSLALVDARGRVLSSSQPVLVGRSMAAALPEFDASRFLQAQHERRLTMDIAVGRDYLLAYQPINLAAQPGSIRSSAVGGLLLKYDLASAKAAARRGVLLSSFAELGFALLVMLMVVLMLRRWLSQPLAYLQQAVTGISQGDYVSNIGISGSGELAELGAAIGRMQADLGATALERDQNLAALRKSEQRFRTIFAAEPECVKVVGPAGSLLEMNAAGLAMLEAESLDQVNSHGLANFILPQYLAAFTRLYKTAMDGGTGLLEFEISGLRGTRRWLETHAAPLPDGDGQVTSMLGVTRDITARKLAEDNLRQSEARFRHIMESDLIGLLFWDANGALTEANDTFLRMVGYSQDEVRAGHVRWSEMTPPEFRSLDETALREIALAGTCKPYEKAYFRKDGRRVPILIGGTGFPEQPGRGVAFVLDITARKRAERWQQHYADTLDMISAEAPLAAVLESLALFSESPGEGRFCAIQLLSPDGRHLVHGASPSLPDFFNDAVDGIAIGPTSGSCGAAAFSGDLVIARDIDSHPNWTPWRELAAQAGLRACWSHPIVSADGKVLGTFAIYHAEPSIPGAEDLEVIRQSASLAAIALERAKHHEAQRLAKVVFEQSIEGIMVTDTSERVLMVNPAFESLTGFSAAEVIGKTPDLVDAGHHDVALQVERRESLASGGRWKGELRGRKKSGELYAMSMSVATVSDASGSTNRVISIISDISEQKFQAARIEKLAFYDALTGLPNRALFLDRLEQTLASSQRQAGHGALLFLDLDRFKEINDSLGHAVGDLALAEVARRFQSVSRSEETLARLGGDEFVLMAENADKAAAILIAARLQRALALPLDLKGQSYTVGASIGIAFYPDDGQSSEDLIKHTDIAMYRAKASGGGYQLYRPEMGAEVDHRLTIAKHLARALDDDGLQLHYQPQIDLYSGRVIGAEVLLRWNSPALGWIGPAEFVPIAEERGMMGPLGDWVVRQACRQIHAWADSGARLDGRLAINVSALQMEDPDFVARLLEIVRDANLDPSRFELELTESSMMMAPERAVKVMAELSAAGFSLSIDDFGTGYSSLAYLKRFVAHQIKIDISFVRNMLTDSNDHTIVTTIIAMARTLGLRTTAEGVEEAGQAAALRSLGCDIAQGYYFGRPEPGDVFREKWLAADPRSAIGIPGAVTPSQGRDGIADCP